MTDELIALVGAKEIGRVHRHARGRLTFAYDDAWRNSAEAYPLSLSMSLGAKEHGPEVVENFLWGLFGTFRRFLSSRSRFRTTTFDFYINTRS